MTDVTGNRTSVRSPQRGNLGLELCNLSSQSLEFSVDQLRMERATPETDCAFLCARDKQLVVAVVILEHLDPLHSRKRLASGSGERRFESESENQWRN